MSDQRDIESEKLIFEKEKWQTEKAQRDRELALQEAEQNRTRWTNPLVIAIFTAALAGALNIVLAYVNATATQALEQGKSESALILEMIKTNSSDKAAENLGFIADAGLLTNKNQVDRIRAYLQVRKPGQGPVLPASGSDRLTFDNPADLAPNLQAALKDQISRYSAYLEGLGFSNLTHSVRLITFSADGTLPPGIQPEEASAIRAGWVSFYNNGSLFVRKDFIGRPFYPLREYSHHALMQAVGGQREQTEIESALADYFPAGFLMNESEAATSRSDVSFLDSDSVASTNADTADPVASLVETGHMWAAAFWQCRKKVGKSIVDGALLRAWVDSYRSRNNRDPKARFKSAVLRTKGDSAAGPSASCLVEEVDKRKLSVTSP